MKKHLEKEIIHRIKLYKEFIELAQKNKETAMAQHYKEALNSAQGCLLAIKTIQKKE